MVADALSRKSYGSLAYMDSVRSSLFLELQAMNVNMKVDSQEVLLTTLRVRPIMVEQVKEAQAQDARLSKIVEEVKSASRDDYSLREDGTLMLGDMLCVPNV